MKFRTFQEIEAILRSQVTPSTRTLCEIWEQRQVTSERKEAETLESLAAETSVSDWLKHDVSLAVSFVKCALKREEYLLVSDAARDAVSYWQGREHVDPRPLSELETGFAIAKSRTGQSAEAFRSLEPWSRDARLDKAQRAGILLQLGDILNDEAHSAVNPSTRFQRGERALKHYLDASELMPGLIEPRVKLAMALLSVSADRPTRQDEARKWADETLGEIARNQAKDGKDFRSTLYTAMLLAVAGKLDEAARAYQVLDFFPEASIGELADARHEAQFIALALGQPKGFFKAAFPPLEIIVFAGHMPDLPGIPSRFPPDLIPRIKSSLRNELEKVDARIALLSAAAGADLLFIEAFLERQKTELHLVLPWSKEEFFRTSVQPYDGQAGSPVWAPLFEMAVERASTLRQLGQLSEPGDEVGWQYAMEVSAGIAVQTARVSRLDLRPVALWDGLPGRGAGGTAHFVEFWNNFLREPPLIIKLPQDHHREEQVVRKSQPERCEKPTMHREVKTMLFADIVGYSKLAEGVIPEFVKVFLNKLSRLIAESPYFPLCINMWGDEIYGVFDHAREGGLFGLQLSKFLREEEKEWLKKGLYYEQVDPAEQKLHKFPLNIRVGLHTGPVLAIYNPVVRQLTYTGSHVTRAARIQPVVVPGEVYASEEFAALLELDMASRSLGGSAAVEPVEGNPVCKYVGTIQLAKSFPGRFRVYSVVAERTFPTEELAAAAHQLYCQTQLAKGDVADDSLARAPWQELPEQFREANRSQVADIPFKLGLIGYELSSGPGFHAKDLKLTADQIEMLAQKEHERWMMERERSGWTHAPQRDDSRKHHPSMVPWESLPEPEKEKDREVIRALPKLIEMAGLRLTR